MFLLQQLHFNDILGAVLRPDIDVEYNLFVFNCGRKMFGVKEIHIHNFTFANEVVEKRDKYIFGFNLPKNSFEHEIVSKVREAPFRRRNL